MVHILCMYINVSYTCLYGLGRCPSQIIYTVLESIMDLHTGKEINFFFSECNKWRTSLLSKFSFTGNSFYLCLDEKVWIAKQDPSEVGKYVQFNEKLFSVNSYAWQRLSNLLILWKLEAFFFWFFSLILLLLK